VQWSSFSLDKSAHCNGITTGLVGSTERVICGINKLLSDTWMDSKNFWRHGSKWLIDISPNSRSLARRNSVTWGAEIICGLK